MVLVSAASDDECKDDPDWYFKADVRSGSDVRKCAAIARDPENRCETRTSPEGVVAKEACRLSCGTCNENNKKKERSGNIFRSSSNNNDDNDGGSISRKLRMQGMFFAILAGVFILGAVIWAVREIRGGCKCTGCRRGTRRK